MPLYRLVCIAAHYPTFEPLKKLVKGAASHVIDNGGVVRNIDSWGTHSLPQTMKRAKQYYTLGDYWTMQFDASPTTLRALNNMLRRDPSVVRWTNLKVGEKVLDVRTFKEQTVKRPLSSSSVSSSASSSP